MPYDEIRETMSFVLEGGSELDIQTFTSILSNTSKILKKTTQYSQDGEFQKFVISDVRKGSFIVDLTSVLVNNPTLITTASTALTMFKTFLDIKTQIGQSPVKEVIHQDDGVKVETNNGVINIYNNATFNAYTEDTEIDDRLTTMMNNIKNDTGVTGLQINHDSMGGYTATKYDPELLSKKADIPSLNNTLKTEVSRQKIKLTKVDFEGNSKWMGYIGMNKESFIISDNGFKRNLDEFSFSVGTILDCDLEVHFSAHPNGIPIQDTKYRYNVLRVHDVIKPFSELQTGLDLKDNV